MSVDHYTDAFDGIVSSRPIDRGSILVNPSGLVKIVRSRNAEEDGWNCADGAGISDIAANDPELWRVYTPERLAEDLALAADVRDLGRFPELGGGLATWDACSGRRCVLPKLARMLN